MATPPCEVLPWDSGFFGCRVGRVLAGRLDRAGLAAVDSWCREQAIDCLYFLADSEDPATAALAEEGGFRLVDLRVTLERPLTPDPSPIPSPPPGEGRPFASQPRDSASSDVPPSPGGREGMGEAGQGGEGPLLRPASLEDIPQLRRIAARSHRDSRFYADPHFPRSRCDELYATWIEKSCRGMDADPGSQLVLTAGVPETGGPAGYISCILRGISGGTGEREGEIGLLAVDAAAQGRGLGGALVSAALRWLAERGALRVRVVTQGRNTRAQRLYQAHGLLTCSIGLWFHRWDRRGTP
jgi:dTDP-4-amino-4,6-dideoxy-D-galactose acyltransferase